MDERQQGVVFMQLENETKMDLNESEFVCHYEIKILVQCPFNDSTNKKVNRA